ncbi:hypothetical protein P4S72_05935 [Vibrio sp. PP-XX7]
MKRFPRRWKRRLEHTLESYMFRYFPTNYPWDLSINLALEMGARIGEIEAMCAPLQDAAKAKDTAGSKAFRDSWVQMADKFVRTGERR